MGARTVLGTRLIRRMFGKRFFLAKLTNIPVIGSLMELIFFHEDDMIVVLKDEPRSKSTERTTTIEINGMVEPVETMLPSLVVEHFIRESRYIFLMNSCMCRVANHCEDYPRDLGCIFLGKGVLRIDPSMGRMVTQDEALEHLRKCREAGLVHLIGRNKIDSVWLDTGPKEDLLSLCSCCPCCCLWKMIPDLSREISGMVTRMPGLEIIIDEQRCIGCGECERPNVCYVGAIKVFDGRAKIDDENCKGCGRCAEACPEGAIKLNIVDPEFMASAIDRIEPLVDIRSE